MKLTKQKTNADYRRKIKTREELREIIGARPRNASVIMCHGSFDIVHPGHVRHLMYAAEKADILVASLTSDAHISKANFRPYVPEQLRAMNLAALEVVDYVIIDSNPTPIENLKFIQPDYFAKGYDYSSSSTAEMNPKTKEEKDVIESYGGEMILTPGDVVFSSSAFIEQAPPNISADKLGLLMKSEGISFNDLRETLQKFQGKRVHVIGDTIVDSYTYGSVIGGMTKTPTFSVKFERQVDYVGGAAIVAKHLHRAGARVKFTSVLGNDPLKKFVLDDLEKEGIECDVVIDKTRPTTQKNAIIAGGYRLLKLDTLDNRAISDKILNQFKNALKNSETDAFVFSDFRHGIFSKRTIPELIGALPKGPLRVADSQVASRWGNILEFQNFDLITPNEREARFALGDQDSVVRPLALDLYHKSNCKYLILKMGERGSITYRPADSVDDPRAFFTLDSFADKVVDAVGAGDALLSYATLSLIATKNIVLASILGSMGAAIACDRDGNVPISPEEMTNLIDATEKRVNYT